jgi:hypothetical protein
MEITPPPPILGESDWKWAMLELGHVGSEPWLYLFGLPQNWGRGGDLHLYTPIEDRRQDSPPRLGNLTPCIQSSGTS